MVRVLGGRAILLCCAVGTLASPGCGARRRFDLSGTWSGGFAQDHSAREVMTLRQDGDAISGLVCRISSLHRVFYDVPVSGRYPMFTFPYFADTVTGWAAGEDLIVANRTGAVSYEMHFTRTDASDYEACRNAAP
jgi:hypothetical protein